MDIAIEPARPEDVDAVLRLLDENKLPRDGWRDHLDTTVVAQRAGKVVGVAALEIYADGALMRSVAVAPALQGQGLGHRLTSAVLQMAHERHIRHAYLLTTTAERFFPKFGFDRIERSDVPVSVQQSVEFRSACPSSAIVMRKTLDRMP
jgi:amino-acid N-acetyltransferase